MTDETKGPETADKIDPRETPAFRGVLKQLEAERSEKAALADRLRALEDESSTRKQAAERKQLEQAGKYEEALKAETSAWESRHAAIQQELATAKAEHERARVVADLASHGVTGKARDFLASSYLSTPERPDLLEWIETAKIDTDFGMFFSSAKARTPQPGDMGGRAAGPTAGKVDWDAIKAARDSRDPIKAREAIALIKEHFDKTGQSPFK